MPPKQDLNRSGWESTDMPSACEKCLGDNPYVQVLKEDYGAECKICTRPFTVFRWKTDRTARQKRTNLCLTCARLKNCCQCCMLDLSFGLPIVVRDAALKMITPGPNSEINREYYAQNHEKEIEEGRGAVEAYDKTDEKARDLLRRLAQSEPHYKKQRRLEEEGAASGSGQKMLEGPSSEAARPGPIRTKDSRPAGYGPPSRPVKGASRARPFPNTAALPPQPQDILPPAAKHVMSLFVTGVEDDLPEHEIRVFFSQFGALRSLICSHRSHCAFVNYMTRDTAEAAAAACQGRAVVKGVPLRVQWGRPKTLDNMDRDARMANARAGRETSAAVKAASSTRPAIAAGNNMFLIIPKSRQQKETSRIIGTSGEREDVPESMPKHLRGPTRVQNACDECRIRKIKCNGQNPCGRCRSRNTVCVFNFAEAKKRLKGPMTAAQASTLEAQQARVLDALKNMSVVIDRLEASLSTATGKETIMEHDRELGARLANAEQDSGYDLNAILEKYAPIRQVSNNDSSVDLDHLETGEARSKRQRISHPENSGSLNPAIGPFDLPQTRTCDNLTPFTYEAFSQNNLGDLAGNVDNPFELRPLEQMNPRFCNQMDTQYPHNTHASCIAPPRSTDRSLNPLAFSITDRSEESNPNCDANQPGDSTVLSPSLETFFLQCQDMDTLIESIDWDMSRAVSARLLKDTEKSS